VETLGGLLYQVLGRVPEVGEIISVEPVSQKEDAFPSDSFSVAMVRFKVLEVEENRIGKVEVGLLSSDNAEINRNAISAGKSEGKSET